MFHTMHYIKTHLRTIHIADAECSGLLPYKQNFWKERKSQLLKKTILI